MSLSRLSRIVIRLAHVCLFAALSVAATPASALDATHVLTQYGHTVWSPLEGDFVGFPTAVTQTADGYLWVGTNAGVFRFDGVKFTPVALDVGQTTRRAGVYSLLAARDGTLWVGRSAEVTAWKGGQIVHHPLVGRIMALALSADDDVWASRASGNVIDEGTGPLCHVTRTQTLCFNKKDGIQMPLAQTLAAAGDGSLWVASPARLEHWKQDASFETYAIAGKGASEDLSGIAALAVAGDGSLWVGSEIAGPGLGLQRFVGGRWVDFAVPGLVGARLMVKALLIDREGALWVGTSNDGLYRIFDGHAEHFRSTNGLSSNSVTALFEDDEGDLWVGTSGGLDRFRDVRVASVSQAEGLGEDQVQSVSARQNGDVVAGNTNGVDEVGRDLRSERIKPAFSSTLNVTKALEDTRGRLWVGVGDGLVTIDHGSAKPVSSFDGKAVGSVIDLAQDDAGTLWVLTAGHPGRLLRVGDDRVARLPAPRPPPSQRLIAASGGGLWLATTDATLVRYRGGKVERFAYPHSMKSMFIAGLVQGPGDRVYGAMPDGLVAWHDGRIRVLAAADGLPCSRVYAPALDRHDNLWLYTACGLVRVSAEDLANWWSQPGYKIKPKLFDSSDGVQPGEIYFGTAAARSVDGRLWFANGAQLQVVDPDRIADNPVVPPVHIESLVANHQAFKSDGDLHLGSDIRDLEIDYTALSFMAPQKVRFRYKLEGHDLEWQEAGARRQAFYTDLQPGKYTFHVTACNNDGVWNTRGATLAFVVTPTFMQSAAFMAICIVAGVLLVGLIIKVRLRQLSAQFRVRIDERERIARELHDTLLQSVHAVMMMFHAALQRTSRDLPGRAAIERAVDQAEAVATEGRNRIHGLRAKSAFGGDLAQALEASARLMDAGAVHTVSCAATGLRTLDAEVYEELYRLGSEALRNISKHARATKIDIDVTSQSARLVVSIRDDGIGLAREISDGPGVPGHWGLQGMRERAARIGAVLEFLRSPPGGTEVRVTVPATRAYAQRRPLWRRIRFLMRRR